MEDLWEIACTESSSVSIQVCGELQPTRKGMVEIHEDTNEAVDPCDICKNIYEVDTKIRYEMQYTNMYDDFTFSEAFKLCRQCQGNDGIFYWKDNLYLTEIKESSEKIKEKGIIQLKPLQK